MLVWPMTIQLLFRLHIMLVPDDPQDSFKVVYMLEHS